MHERDLWIKIIEQTMDEYHFEEGYKIVFGPWSTLSDLNIAFFTDLPSLNVPKGAQKELISEEEEINTYEKELETRRPRINRKLSINRQFLEFSKFVNRMPLEIMTGVVIPFRAKNWDSMSQEQQQIAKFIGKTFWTGPLLQPSIELIVTSGEVATDLVLEITNGKLVENIKSGWGKVRLKRYSTFWGKTIVKLPYLGIFKLFSKLDCKNPLEEIFDGFCNGQLDKDSQ